MWKLTEGTFLPEDRSIENKIIILALLQKAQEKGHSVLTRTQVHKLLFVSEQEMWRQRILSSGFRFIKMDHGPWSQDIENTLAQLEALGLVQTQEISTLRGDDAKLASLTQTGSELLRSIMEAQSTGPEDVVMQAIEDALTQYGDLPSAELQEVSHSFRNLTTRKTVDETAPRKYLLKPRPRTQATAVLEPEDSVRETLDIMEDRELHDSIVSSIEQVRHGVFRPYHPGGVISTNDEEHRGL